MTDTISTTGTEKFDEFMQRAAKIDSDLALALARLKKIEDRRDQLLTTLWAQNRDVLDTLTEAETGVAELKQQRSALDTEAREYLPQWYYDTEGANKHPVPGIFEIKETPILEMPLPNVALDWARREAPGLLVVNEAAYLKLARLAMDGKLDGTPMEKIPFKSTTEAKPYISWAKAIKAASNGETPETESAD